MNDLLQASHALDRAQPHADWNAVVAPTGPERQTYASVPGRRQLFSRNKRGRTELSPSIDVVGLSDVNQGAIAHVCAAEAMIEQRSMDQRRKGDPSLDEARLRQQAIGVKLRQMFDQVVNEPVPDEFLDILKRADRREAGQD